jgi:hypothetical protein
MEKIPFEHDNEPKLFFTWVPEADRYRLTCMHPFFTDVFKDGFFRCKKIDDLIHLKETEKHYRFFLAIVDGYYKKFPK